MDYFPLVQTPQLAGAPCADRYDRFACRARFSPGDYVRREHLPDYVSLDHAIFRLSGEPGVYDVEFPRGRRRIELKDSDVELDVANLVAVGRHTYAVYPAQPARFGAELEIQAIRPTVDTTGGTYRLSASDLRYGRKLQLEDNRNVQRVGRFAAWVATLPESFNGAVAATTISLNGTWRHKQLPPASVEDPSRTWYDDTDWKEVEVPFKAEETEVGGDALLWFRRRIDIPIEWDDSVYLRFAGVDDEVYVFVNGHEAGYHCGWHRPFQLDVTPYLEPGDANIIVVRCAVRRPLPFYYDGGMTYNFVKDYALNHYPVKSEPLGGIFKAVELARLDHAGPVRFVPRFHPQPENRLTVTLALRRPGGDTRETPLAVSPETVLDYAPPVMRYEQLNGGAVAEVVASYSEPLALFRVNLNDADASEPDRVPSLVVRVRRERLDVPEQEAGMHGEWDEAELEPLDEEAGAVFAFSIDADGKPVAGSRAAQRFDEEVAAWERHVYERTKPLRTTPAETAYIRTVKQVLSLVSKIVPGEISGLFTDLIKYPIFWLRDTAISIPGTLYGGDLAHDGAVAAAGEIYARARNQPDRTILNPDGTMHRGQRASDAPPLAVYSIYRVWCTAGDEWLHEYFPTVVSYMDYLDQVEGRFGNEPDGFIRASDGDWWDYIYHPRYEREGAVFFVNVLYLRALARASLMAEAVGDNERAQEWRRRFESGRAILNRPVEDGGLLMTDRGYFADTVMTLYDDHPNGYAYPGDLERVTVMGGFRPIPHAIALAEGLITDRTLANHIVELIDRHNIIRPFPGLVQYPWYDFMGREGVGGPYETGRFRKAWKSVPGNHTAGGRWAFAGGLVMKALWSAGASDLAAEAIANAAGAATISRQPARVFEDAHYSGLFRNESGDAKDSEGFYYNWGAATPLEALVEGKYGILAVPGGVRVHLERIPRGDGIEAVPAASGYLTVRHEENDEYVMAANEGSVVVYVPVTAPEGVSVVDGLGKPLPGDGSAFVTSDPPWRWSDPVSSRVENLLRVRIPSNSTVRVAV